MPSRPKRPWFQFLIGTIQTTSRLIDPCGHVVGFQFLIGTIQTVAKSQFARAIQIQVSIPHRYDTNSRMSWSVSGQASSGFNSS